MHIGIAYFICSVCNKSASLMGISFGSASFDLLLTLADNKQATTLTHCFSAVAELLVTT